MTKASTDTQTLPLSSRPQLLSGEEEEGRRTSAIAKPYYRDLAKNTRDSGFPLVSQLVSQTPKGVFFLKTLCVRGSGRCTKAPSR